ncbi:hypothetical protein BC835DRAFT_1100202 [Cytidiella melzeri]|nr:hypothetical protein BC835DRAFT_1100202 [Cytidiella melzeri]
MVVVMVVQHRRPHWQLQHPTISTSAPRPHLVGADIQAMPVIHDLSIRSPANTPDMSWGKSTPISLIPASSSTDQPSHMSVSMLITMPRSPYIMLDPRERLRDLHIGIATAVLTRPLKL